MRLKHPTRETNLTGRVGRWSAQHPWRAVGIWLAFVVVALVAGGAAGSVKLTDAQSGVGEAGRAQRVIDQSFEIHAAEQVLLQSRTLRATDPAFAAAIQAVTSGIDGTGAAVDLRSPLEPGNGGQIAADGHSALILFDLNGKLDTAKDRIAPIAAAVSSAAAAHPQISIAETGDATIGKAIADTVDKDLKGAEKLSLPITLFVLLFTFGALVAATLPLGLAITAILAASGLLGVSSHLIATNDAANSVLLLIGLAVGVDYSLFYVKREREERAAGSTNVVALHAAAATSGRSVLISGITVLVAMSGLFLSGSNIFYGIAVAAMLVVAVAMVGSLTVLPALLALLGDRVEKGRIPYLSRHRHAERDSRAWGFVLDRALRRPVISVTFATGILLVLAVPLLHIHTSTPAASDLPSSIPALRTYNAIQQAFPGGPAPAIVAVQAPDVTAPSVRAGVAALEREALASGQAGQPIHELPSPDGRVLTVAIPLVGNGENAASAHALDVLRHQIIPNTVGQVPGVRADVTGLTAGTEDFNSLTKARVPIVFAFVLILAFLLLLISFRSLVIAVKAIALNLLSVAAAYGVLVAVFQWGWGESALGFTSTHSITSWLPLFLFVVLFGLSMDYHVFILSRVRELHDRGLSTSDAVAGGIKSTAGTVTSAAVVMVFVFLTFATLRQVSLKEMGVGLATAVLLDATLVRGVLLPATMTLLGEANWYLPSWLNWLPNISHTPQLPAAGLPQQRQPIPDAASEAPPNRVYD
jgi:RND superfamily putative drug exporter